MKLFHTRIAIALDLAESIEDDYISYFIINYISKDIKKSNKILDISRARDVLYRIKSIDTNDLIKILHYGC